MVTKSKNVRMVVTRIAVLDSLDGTRRAVYFVSNFGGKREYQRLMNDFSSAEPPAVVTFSSYREMTDDIANLQRFDHTLTITEMHDYEGNGLRRRA